VNSSKLLGLNSDTPVVKTKEGFKIQHSTLPRVDIERFIEWYKKFYGEKK